jgi:hypothetical protein
MNKQIKTENILNEFPLADLEHSPRILREEADVIESNASGMGERKMRWAAMEASGLRYLAALVEIGDYATAYAVTNEWSLAQRTRIPASVFTFMGAAFRRNNS